MNHDIKKYKLLKKILGILGYKLLPKEMIKTERFIESFANSCSDFIQFLIKEKKINQIIQVGANDGKSDDFLRSSINKDTKAVLVEPIESAFTELKKNYSGFTNVEFVNKAIDINNGKKNIYSVNPKYYDYYEKKFNSKDASWLTVLASFEKNHLKNHGVKLNHIHSTEIECVTFNELISQYNLNQLGLLVIDVEGYDSTLVKNFIQSTNLRPVIIFEWIHMEMNDAQELVELLKADNYKFLKVGKDLICYQNNFVFS
jgi:FkbM family methyltransferase